MKRTITCLISSALLLSFAPVARATDSELTVMSRNIYLGADVGVAMELLPDFPAATQFMWDQMRKTDFPARSKLLAKEIESENPDVIGIQEATKWYCQKGPVAEQIVVFDFVNILLEDLQKAGLNYEIASKGENFAQNVGFEIAPIPLLTKASDNELFPELFSSTEAFCGFEIADVLLIKQSLASSVLAVGTAEYKEKYTIIPTVMSIYRGYSWADISINGKPVRFVTTHLESSFDDQEVPVSKIQADQLLKDLEKTKIPIVLIGDFNSDPRDPRSTADLNPGGQPAQNEVCQPQVSNPTKQSAIAQCSAYWTIVQAGFTDVGPDSGDAQNFTWGMDALLTGPEQNRLAVAQKLGNTQGFTDRLDYVFIKGSIEVADANLIGQFGSAGWASDHAGLVAKFQVTEKVNYAEIALAQHNRFPLGFWQILALVGFGLIVIRFTKKRLAKSSAKSS